MIVSDVHRYVFVEVPHTGSTAVRSELARHYAGENFLRKHATYRDFLRAASPEQRSYRVIAGVRHPLDLAVTRYFRLSRGSRERRLQDSAWLAAHGSVVQRREYALQRWVQRTGASFERFLLRWYRLPYDSWSSLDRKHYDFVLRFESLPDDFAATLRALDIEPVNELPRLNVTPDRERDFTAYYTPRAIRRAAWVFGPYMAEWGYDFPAQWGDVRTPVWGPALLRATRAARSIYWKYLRFRNPRRPSELSADPFLKA